MKIVVTGSLGLIGNALVEKLGTVGVTCIPLDIRLPKEDPSYADICDKKPLKSLLGDCDGVIHLAAVSRIAWGETRPDICNTINIEGTRNLLEACLASPNKPWFVFASSREVYGEQKDFPVDENCVLNPNNVYANSKFAAEKLVEDAFHAGLKSFIVRFSNVYGGANDHIDRVVPAFCVNAIKNTNLRIYGPECIYDFTYIDDVIEGLEKIISFISKEKRSILPKIHLASGEPTSLLDLARKIIKITGSNSKLDIKAAKGYGTHKFYGDTTNAESLLGWRSQNNISEGLHKFMTKLENLSKEDEIYNSRLIFSGENFKSYSWLPSAL
jgi:UDP-glucose 4-epimerase